MAAHEAPPSLGFSRQEDWSGLPFPFPTHEREKWKWSRSVVSNSATPWTAAHQAPLSMGFSRQEDWSGWPLPSPRKMFFPFLSFLLYLYEKMDTCCCCCSVAQSFLTLFAPMGCSMLGFPVLHLLEFAQAHVHWVSDAIQPSHPLLAPSPPTFDLSQHQGLFKMSQLFTSGGQSIWVSASALVPPTNTQDWFPLGWTNWISLLSKGLSRVFSNTTVQKHQFFSAQLSL